MKIKKIKDVKTPTRGTSKSAGFDFYIPNDFNLGENFNLLPQKSINIPSGIICEVPDGYALVAFNKSGVALKGLQVGACVVDEDYTGEVHLHIINTTENNINIQPGQKLVQFLLIPVLYDTIEVVDELERETERGSGGFGSTGLQ